MFSSIEQGYEEGLPLYVNDSKRPTVTKESVFKIIKEDEFLAMDHSDVQEILRVQHIVVTNKQHRKKCFKDALVDIAPLGWVTGIQGDSFLPFDMTAN